jgi:hypothetical protein
MARQFYRLYRSGDATEVYVRLADIWKVEVDYDVEDPQIQRQALRGSLLATKSDAAAKRYYRAFIGNEQIYVSGAGSGPVLDYLEELVQSAINAD